MKFLVFIILLFCSIFNFKNDKVYAGVRYARIENSTNIYSSSYENSSTICIAEKSYFVQILNETNHMYKVNYNNISGYIKKNDVKEITSTPSTPYPTNIKIKIGSDCNLRSTPTTKSQVSNVVCTIKAGETNLEFIGRVFADEAIDFGGTTWYLVRYLGELGYVYNRYISSITPIYENPEKFTYLNNSISTIQNPITNTPSLLLIIIMSIPLLVIILILYAPKKFKKHIKKQKQVKVIDKY